MKADGRLMNGQVNEQFVVVIFHQFATHPCSLWRAESLVQGQLLHPVGVMVVTSNEIPVKDMKMRLKMETGGLLLLLISAFVASRKLLLYQK